MADTSTSDTIASHQNVAVNSTSSKSEDSTKKRAPAAAAKVKTVKHNTAGTVVKNFENPKRDITLSKHSVTPRTAAVAPLELFQLCFHGKSWKTL